MWNILIFVCEHVKIPKQGVTCLGEQINDVRAHHLMPYILILEPSKYWELNINSSDMLVIWKKRYHPVSNKGCERTSSALTSYMNLDNRDRLLELK